MFTSFAITLIYLFLLLIRPQDYVGPLRGIHLVDMIAIPAIIAIGWELRKPSGREVFKSIHTWCMLGIWIAMAASLLLKGRVAESWDAVIFFARVAVPYLLIALTVKNRRQALALLCLLGVFFVFFAVHGYLQKISGVGFGGCAIETRLGPSHPRLTALGPFAGPNELGAIYATGIVFFLGLSHTFLKSHWKTGVCLAGIPLLFLPMWWTLSRQSLIILAIGAGLACWPRALKQIWLPFTVTCLVFMVLVPFHFRWQAVKMNRDHTVHQRADYLATSLNLFVRHPLLGVGYNRSPKMGGIGRPFHNSYATMLAENGFLGLFFLVSLGTVTLWRLYYRHHHHALKADSVSSDYSPVCIAVVGAALCGAYFQNRAYQFEAFLYMAMANAYAGTGANAVSLDGAWLKKGGLIVLLGITVSVLALLFMTSRMFT